MISIHTIPMFHGLGGLQIYWAVRFSFLLLNLFECNWQASCGITLAVFEPKRHAQMPTPDALYKAARIANCDIIYSVPAIVEVCILKVAVMKLIFYSYNAGLVSQRRICGMVSDSDGGGKRLLD